jgi:hypothetical protein
VLRDSIVLFMDLLGTRGVRAGAGALEHLRLVRRAVGAARAASFAADPDEPPENHVRWFSDNLAIGYIINQADPTSILAQLVVETGYLHLAFLESGLLGRGAIARGDFFADGTFVYGAALERAVLLEKGSAVHPRCVLDEASVAVAFEGLMEEESNAPGAYWRRHLCVDGAGIVFVDYLGIAKDDPASHGTDLDAVLGQHRDLVLSGLHRFDGSERIVEKYRWLAGYHNHAVAGLLGEPERGSLLVRSARPVGGFRAFDAWR